MCKAIMRYDSAGTVEIRIRNRQWRAKRKASSRSVATAGICVGIGVVGAMLKSQETGLKSEQNTRS